MLFRSLHFCLSYLLAFVATFLAMVVLNALGGLTASTAVLFILPLIIASMVEGQAFVRRFRTRPSNYECWRAALRMTAMVVLMMLAVVIPMLILYPGSAADLAEIDAVGRSAVYLLLCFCACCILRGGYAFGLATELKGQQFSDE